ncbi:MAG TPA: Vms1/Ankzf1 family peptidyl-tRNA hydrolase [Nocardioides sp.]|uniref:baeRF2 domain-containing protein n=1 Tax=Nocardioides sp. TaxID=35761 RepID=UPI002F3F0F92
MDLERLRTVFETPGPYLTLHVDVSRNNENAAEQVESRWTSIRHELERAAIPDSLVPEIDERIHENTHVQGEVRRTIVAAADRILLDDVQAGHNPHPEVVDVADLPDLAPWIDIEDQAYPFVLAVVDRTGGEVSAYRAASQEPVDEETVTGATYYITKVPEGDWAQKQFQQTAENRWHENAELVAEAVRSAALADRARAVLVAGEVRARAEVVRAVESLDHGFDGVIEIESGGRAEGASEEALWGEVHEKLRQLVAAEDADVAARLDQGRGRGEGVATGIDEVLGALVKGQVEQLVVDLAALAEKSVKPGQYDGLPLPASAADADELPADRVLVAAAALTGADLTVLPASMAHGGGASALLRWDDSTKSGSEV